MLTLERVCSGYRGLQILHDVSLEVQSGEIVALVGANGAGKTTMLRTVSGLVRATSGRITFGGQDITAARPERIVRAGLVQVAEGRELFGSLSVHENIDMGSWTTDGPHREELSEQVYSLFPILGERRRQLAETLSGGEQQMLAIGRALMAKPRLLMLDEPSIGLAPKLVTAVLDSVQKIRESGVTVLIVEQNAAKALAISDRAYVLESGAVVIEGAGKNLVKDAQVRRAYLGL